MNDASKPRGLQEYRELRDRVDGFFARVASEPQSQLHCQAGCSGCCQSSLTVTEVEAESIQAFLASRTPLPRQPEQSEKRCVFLAEGVCEIYPVRPLVCRSQGLALRYPKDTVPVESIRWKHDQHDVVACPLNYQSALPNPSSIMNAERVDTLLGVINQRFCATSGRSPSSRVALTAIRQSATGPVSSTGRSAG